MQVFQLFVERSLSYDKNMFNFLRKCQNVFQSGCTILHSHQEWMKIPVAPHPHQRLVLCFGFSSFLMTYDVEHLSMCLFAICISFVICLLRSLAHFLTGLFFCWVLRFLCIFWIIVLYQMHLLQVFSPSVACLFITLTLSLQSTSFKF